MTEPLFQPKRLEPLFKEGQPTAPPSEVQANAAYSESIALRDPQGFEERKRKPETILDGALEAVREQLRHKKVPLSPLLEPETFVQLDPDRQLEVVNAEMRRVNSTVFSVRQYAMIMMMREGYGEAPIEKFDDFYRKVDPNEIIDRMNYDNRMARRAAFRDLNQYNAANGWNNGAEALLEVGIGDLTPLWPLLSRWGVIEALEEAVGLEDVNGFWLGSGRQKIRDSFLEMSPTEFEQAAKAWTNKLEELKRDPVMGKLLSKYNVMELHEAVFTDDVIDGVSAANKGDLYLGNLETFLESVFTVLVVGKAGLTTMKALTKTGEVSAHSAARAANPALASRVEDDLDVPSLSIEFNLLPEETAAAKLPRPATLFNGQVDEFPDGNKATVLASERLASEIVERSGRVTELGLTSTDKAKQVNRAIADLDLDDGAHVQGRMNELAMLDDGSGYRMRVVVGETAERGYRDIKDAMDEVLDIDPDLEFVNIHRVNGDGVLEPVFDSPLDYARALTKGEVDTRTAERLLEDRVDESYYLVYDREHFWNPIDKEAFGAETFQSGWMPRFMLSPNAKFGEDIYPQFLKAYMEEQALIKDFDIMFKPFYDLSAADKKFVNSVFEVQEQFAKNYGRAMDINELRSLYPHMTPAQIDGIVALQTGFDTMHHLFDRRLYRQGVSLGWKTARPVDSSLPLYHGKILDEAEASKSAKYYDPVSQEMVPATKAELEDIYRQGGGVMELDVPLEVGPKSRATHILLKGDDYDIGELSTRILKYHPGYAPRFYEDPYYIIKRTEGAEVNGSRVSGKQGTIVEAIKTSGTAREAQRFAKRANYRNQQRGVEGETFEVVRANDIDQTDSTLFQKQALHREGRLFWDDRNFDRLPDVNGNRAELENPVKSLERWVGQAARQLTHEDLIRTVRRAWKNDFGDLLDDEAGVLLDRLELGELSKRLKSQRGNTVDRLEKKRYQQAKELLDYMRMIDGTQSGIVPRLREATLDLAIAVESWTKTSKTGRGTDRLTGGMLNKTAKALEKVGGTLDPFRAMRSTAFNLFLVFRPVRQALLQSAQIGYLAGLDPAYIASGKIFTDSLALRRGLAAIRKSNYDDGFSSKSMAKMMGLTHSEYRTLIREFDRSGLLELVDVHSFAGGSQRFRKTYPGTTGTIGYRARQFTTATRDWFQKVGFDFGERNNLTFTYALALRRYMKNNGIKSINDLSRTQWSDIKVNASNLALGMVKPNNFRYQVGGWGVATQFLSFSHKAMLGMLAQNPAISMASAARIWAGTLLLYGANMFGARDLVEQALKDEGIPDYQITDGISTSDFLAAGLIDTIFNALGETMFEDYKNVDFGFIAPGLDFPRFFDMTLRNIVDQPYQAALGPFGNVASNTMQAMNIVHTLAFEDDQVALEDKFMGAASVLGSAVSPQLNDITRSYLGYKMGLWYTKSNEPMGLRATFNGLLARGLFGARTKEEMAYYANQADWWAKQEDYQNTVQEMNKYLNTTITLFYDGKARPEDVKRAAMLTHALADEMPEPLRIQFRKDIFNGIQQNDRIQPSLFKVIVDGAIANPRYDATRRSATWDHLEMPEQHRQRLNQMADEAYSNKTELIRKIEEEERGD